MRYTIVKEGSGFEVGAVVDICGSEKAYFLEHNGYGVPFVETPVEQPVMEEPLPETAAPAQEVVELKVTRRPKRQERARK